ncbi:MAG: c-type cytochrome [Caldimonas sp.]
MKSIGLTIAALAMAFSAVPTLAGGVGEGEFRYCEWCHGEAGQGYSTAPRLAGQSDQYIESQLWNYLKHKRVGQLMWSTAAFISAQNARDAAVYFSKIPPKAAGDGDRAIAPAGKIVYQEGIPDANIVACAPCHGPTGEGLGEIPRLGGLSQYYLKARLDQWAHGHDAAAPSPMPHIASQLSPNEIDALASYLSFVK